MFRDDETARAEYVAALERDARRAGELAARVRELEAENRELRARLARLEPKPASVAGDGVYLDGKIVEYIQRIIDATHAEAHEQTILSGALQVDAMRIAERAKQLASAAARRYVVPADVIAAAREILPTRILVRGDAAAVVADILTDVVNDILTGVEVP